MELTNKPKRKQASQLRVGMKTEYGTITKVFPNRHGVLIETNRMGFFYQLPNKEMVVIYQ
tara:strand:+ start:11468 stop:11647 length:180 start_codon:yes stop_codon:yes gene_type:complete